MSKTPDRRTVLKAIGTTSAMATSSTASALPAKSNSLEADPEAGIDHDLEVLNQTPEAHSVSLAIRPVESEASGPVTRNLDLEPNASGVDRDAHSWRRENLSIPGGEVEVTVETGDGQSKTRTVPLAAPERRDFQALSIAIVRDRILIGRLQE